MRHEKVAGFFCVLTMCAGTGLFCRMIPGQNSDATISGPDPREIPVPPIKTAMGTLPGVNELPVRREMPDVMVMNNGKKVANHRQWQKRREEMKRILANYAIGQMPPAPGNVKGKEVQSEMVLEGKVKYRLVHLTFGPSEKLELNIGIFTPAEGGPFPAIILQDGTPPGARVLPRLPQGPNQGRGDDVLLLVGPRPPQGRRKTPLRPPRLFPVPPPGRPPPRPLPASVRMCSAGDTPLWFSTRTTALKTPPCEIPMGAGLSATLDFSRLIPAAIGESWPVGPGAPRGWRITSSRIPASTRPSSSSRGLRGTENPPWWRPLLMNA